MFFDPVKIGPYDQEFADGGLICNNPIEIVHREARATWGSRADTAMLISIGTGSAPGGNFQGNIKDIVEAMKNIVTQTERTADDFYRNHESMVTDDRLFRFNVLHGLADIGLAEWQEKAKMADSTQTYLENGETHQKATLCVKRVVTALSPGKKNDIQTIVLAAKVR